MRAKPLIWPTLLILLMSHAVHAQDNTSTSLEATGFAGYPEAGEFKVAEREQPLPNYPCSLCHQALPVNPSPRAIPIHPTLNHGGGRFWCLTCHKPDDRDFLHSIRDEPVSFEEAYLVCGQCHFSRQRDWYFGVHGKRLDNWRGERVIRNCTHCHNPHSPAIEPRPPQPPPPVRRGLVRQDLNIHPAPPFWQRLEGASKSLAPEAGDD